MKILSKAILIGVINFFIFLIVNVVLGGLVGLIIPGGDDFLNSYFYPLYAAITLLISFLISCTYLVIKKIDLLLDKIQDK